MGCGRQQQIPGGNDRQNDKSNGSSKCNGNSKGNGSSKCNGKSKSNGNSKGNGNINGNSKGKGNRKSNGKSKGSGTVQVKQFKRRGNMSTDSVIDSQHKIAIVTGGSRGIGRATVVSLAKRGVDSILTYNSNQVEAEKVAGLVAEMGRRAIALQLDTGNVGSFDGFVERLRPALESFGATQFDFLVNNAGNNHHNMAFDKTTEEELDSIYSVHFKGVFFLTQKLLPLIKDGGRIVNVSTARTRLISPGGAAYGSIKAATEVLTKFMAKELGPRRIAVNVVAPGATETDFSGGIVRDNPAINKRVAEGTALGRAGLPEDIGGMIASLLSEENRWINAERIEVTGGYV